MRRIIIGNASSLWPYTDRFNPNLLISCWLLGHGVRLQRSPTVHAVAGASLTTLPSFIPTAAARGIDLALDDELPPSRGGLLLPLDGSRRLDLPAFSGHDDVAAPYDKLLSSRDGFLLLAASVTGDLCLRNPFKGICRILPAGVFEECAYTLVTGDDSAVWMVLAVKLRDEDVRGGMTYQIFSSESSEWGPIKRSGTLEEGLEHARIYGTPKDVVVCDDTVYLLGVAYINNVLRRRMFAVDICTERTWMTKLPLKYGDMKTGTSYLSTSKLALATSEDGQRLSLIVSPQDYRMEVWDHIANSHRWTLRRTINVGRLLPSRPDEELFECLRLWGFCPRSGCVLGHIDGQDFLIAVDGGSARPIKRIIGGRVKLYPYEMDWSTYISRTKHF